MFNMNYILPGIGIFILALVIGLMIARLYRRATPTTALVRTGASGLRVVKNGGLLVFPVLHEITKVNMKSTPISVSRLNEAALITANNLRVDMELNFIVRVGDDDQSIARASQTLGEELTFDRLGLAGMVEPKVVDAARAVAAKMTLEDLHSDRQGFSKQVQELLNESLGENGLTLENVAVSSLDQTDYSNLDMNNLFNAEAMTFVTNVVTEQRELQADREAASRIAIADKNNAADRREIQLKRELEEERAQASIKENQARYSEQTAVAKAREESERDAAMAKQDREIKIQNKSREESEARAEADRARAAAIEAEESVKTASLVAIAERNKRIAVTKAEEEAESSATEIIVRARSEKEAAENRATALRVTAESEAEAERIRAAARKEAGLADAEARRAMVEAENVLDPRVIDFQLAKARIEAMPSIVDAMMEPARHIDSIRIIQGGGFGGMSPPAGAASTSGSPANLGETLLSTAMNLPAAKAIGDELGMQLTSGLKGVLAQAGIVEREDDDVPDHAGSGPRVEDEDREVV